MIRPQISWREEALLVVVLLDVGSLGVWILAALWMWGPTLGIGVIGAELLALVDAPRDYVTVGLTAGGWVLHGLARAIYRHFLEGAPDPDLIAHPNELEDVGLEGVDDG